MHSIILIPVMALQGAMPMSADLLGGSVERADGTVVMDILAAPQCTSSETGEIVVCAEPADGDKTAQQDLAESGVPKAQIRLGRNAVLNAKGESVDMQGARSQRMMLGLTVEY